MDCFYYYNLCGVLKVFEVEAIGEVDTHEDKSCTNTIKIIREVPWEEFGLWKDGSFTVTHGDNGSSSYNAASNITTRASEIRNYLYKCDEIGRVSYVKFPTHEVYSTFRNDEWDSRLAESKSIYVDPWEIL